MTPFIQQVINEFREKFPGVKWTINVGRESEQEKSGSDIEEFIQQKLIAPRNDGELKHMLEWLGIFKFCNSNVDCIKCNESVDLFADLSPASRLEIIQKLKQNSHL